MAPMKSAASSEQARLLKKPRLLKQGVRDESPAYVCIKALSVPSLRPASIHCMISIFYNFFFRQYRAALLPGRIPVSRVDHPLDQKIPFAPSWVSVYLDFIAFWLRMLSFLLRRFGRRAFGAVRDFIVSMDKLYAFAAESYRRNLSTTDRPCYIARPRFLLIHLVDPHLMCIPSLHVMVVVLTYTRFAAILRSLNVSADANVSAWVEEVKQGALNITQAILFVKQHSVNCVAAALYAMTRFDPGLFPPEEAEAFTALLFGENLPAADSSEIKAHIIDLYRRFVAEGTSAQSWEEPLLHFMRRMPRLQ
jgi:hypothetical protein